MVRTDETSPAPERLRTGIPGLDDTLGGGLPAHRVYLLEGDPGTGKTTTALQFMLEGVQGGEAVLYATLSESREELQSSAASHGWSLDGVAIREYVRLDDTLSPDTQITMFHPAEVELLETIRRVLADITALNPSRVVIDSLSEIRLLAVDSARYRRQLLALKQFFMDRHCTVLLLDDGTSRESERQIESIVHGVIRLQALSPDYGGARRRLKITKIRGSSYRGGWHDYVIRRGGVDVFPRLVAAEYRHTQQREEFPSGVRALDQLLGGGAQSGSSLLIIGPAGAGKTTVATQFVVTTASRGIQAAMFVFDETADMLLERTATIGLPLADLVRAGKATVQQIDPVEMAPGQFAHVLRHAVENDGVRLIVIDSLNGYLAAMPQERHLTTQLHELLTYLAQQGVTTVLVSGQHGMIGSEILSSIDTSYLADTIVLLRFFEVGGRVKKAISVVKKRGGWHEDTIRELRISASGIDVGDALTQFRGILTGTPVFEGAAPAIGEMVADAGPGRRQPVDAGRHHE